MNKKKKIIWIIVIVVIVAGSIAAWYAYSAFTEKTDTAANLETDMKVEAESLMNEFIDNQKVASDKYREKVIEITGTIVEMQSEDEDALSISLKTSAEDEMGIGRSVRVTLEPNMKSQIEKCKEGDKVTLKGIFNGFDSDLVFNRGLIIK